MNYACLRDHHTVKRIVGQQYTCRSRAPAAGTNNGVEAVEVMLQKFRNKGIDICVCTRFSRRRSVELCCNPVSQGRAGRTYRAFRQLTRWKLRCGVTFFGTRLPGFGAGGVSNCAAIPSRGICSKDLRACSPADSPEGSDVPV